MDVIQKIVNYINLVHAARDNKVDESVTGLYEEYSRLTDADFIDPGFIEESIDNGKFDLAVLVYFNSRHVQTSYEMNLIRGEIKKHVGEEMWSAMSNIENAIYRRGLENIF